MSNVPNQPPAGPPNPPGDPVNSPDSEIYNPKTISEDRSAASSDPQRKLLALREAGHGTPMAPAPPHDNSALQDYQMQMMLLEQRNKRRLMIARQEEDRLAGQSSSPGPSDQSIVQENIDSGTPGNSEFPSAEASRHASAGGPFVSETDQLRAHVALLQDKVRRLEARSGNVVPSRLQVLYRIQSNDDDTDHWTGPFLDPPEIIHGQKGALQLRCNAPLTNFELYLAVNPDISFVVFKNFSRTVDLDSSRPESAVSDSAVTSHKPRPISETVRPVSNDLKAALRKILNNNTEFKEITHAYNRTQELAAPYLFIYHSRGKLPDSQQGPVTPAEKQLHLFIQYVEESHGAHYAAADALFDRNKIRPEYVDYLFKPGDVLVSNKNNEHTGYVAASWPTRDQIKLGAQKSTWTVRGWTWKFDGGFHREEETLTFQIPDARAPNQREKLDDFDREPQSFYRARADQGGDVGEQPDEISITELTVLPIKYASDELVNKLRRRGDTFWKIRKQGFVSYHAIEQESFQAMAEDRYMIDMKTYKRLHPHPWPNVAYPINQNGPETLTEQEMDREQPPDEKFRLLMPTKVIGYSLRLKKWFDLATDRISDVTWNKEAFQSLAIDPKSRDLIQALVSNHLESEYSADLIAGKGNGLILLLHGGPGTGKTLTAESVAEIAEKPLYRVTCGDVGTKPEEVETYLESVLHLGKIWNCVVLLDEADVFLEQRSLEDLRRNALVSVFLRALEYYDGILILTSNRVGTFDEAFKSRIQLALHYPSLGEEQRLMIWETFISRLESVDGEAIDVADLRAHLDLLKKEKLNGRQIRNVITTARQYARWKKNTLTYEYLKDVIDVSGRFDTYLDRLNSDEVQD
ncbi:hypothetical protein NUU61_002701 [Penicillium alfredii]|uniref:AAA+ ATPase domain-containing protein n=1 Tax=Penicillium alfredii TaxID=1506179 RepID=A0A9W9FS16_9EURO|nr:uncharacterized protein NUU61_002701 [Penicillium alfredii]KAJ5105354.1 hypothetical protein NUU61_002701 [Penicillium alfredii]